jgi:hypothetical protein
VHSLEAAASANTDGHFFLSSEGAHLSAQIKNAILYGTLWVTSAAFNIPLCGCWSARRRPALSQSCRAVSSRCGRKAALAELMGTISAPRTSLAEFANFNTSRIAWPDVE